MFCQVEPEQVIAVHNVASTYHVPLLLERQGLITTIRDLLQLDQVQKSNALIKKGSDSWAEWKTLTTAQDRLFDTVNIVLVGKYTSLHDSYLSVIKSLEHCSMRCGKKLNLIWVDASHLEAAIEAPAEYHKAWLGLHEADGILVPGGFGLRGTEGMIMAAKYAREHKKPYLGICLGMQIATIEFARHVCGMPNATSAELNKTGEDQVIIFMPEGDKEKLGGTMRLGRKPTTFQPGTEWSKLRKLYGGETVIDERHRHRYEVNPEYIERLQVGGLHFVGKGDENKRMEILELKDHPWYVAVQFHPEYMSRVLAPSRPYLGFVAAASGCLDRITTEMGFAVTVGKANNVTI